MRALVLAAGFGTRLRPLTDNRPKAMVPVNGRPMVDFTLDWLAHHGVKEVAINLHHAPDALRRHVADGRAWGVDVCYSFEERLLGSAGALVPLRNFFEDQEAFVVIYGDVLTNLNLGEVAARHRGETTDATIVVTTSEDPTRCGVVECDDAGRILRLVEKPAATEVFSEWVNAGVYVCSPAVLEALPAPCPVPYDFAADLFPGMLAAGRRLTAFPTRATVIDVGSLERLRLAGDAVRRGLFDHPWAGVASC